MMAFASRAAMPVMLLFRLDGDLDVRLKSAINAKL